MKKTTNGEKKIMTLKRMCHCHWLASNIYIYIYFVFHLLFVSLFNLFIFRLLNISPCQRWVWEIEGLSLSLSQPVSEASGLQELWLQIFLWVFGLFGICLEKKSIKVGSGLHWLKFVAKIFMNWHRIEDCYWSNSTIPNFLISWDM